MAKAEDPMTSQQIDRQRDNPDGSEDRPSIEPIETDDLSLEVDISGQKIFVEHLSFVNIQKSFVDASISLVALCATAYAFFRFLKGGGAAEDIAVAIVGSIVALSFAFISLGEFQLSIRGRKFIQNITTRRI